MTNDTAQLLAALTRQEELLKRLITALDKPKLGFTNDIGAQFIYCNRSNGCLWYTLDADRKPQPITHRALTGHLRELRFEKVERRGKETHKLLTTILADKTYILESGYDSNFSKCLLSAIATATPEQLIQPITISPQPGDDEAVLFCRVWVGGEYVKVSYGEELDWREIAKAALANVKSANEMPF